MNQADLTRILMNTELEEYRNLTREQARAIVNESSRPSHKLCGMEKSLACRSGTLEFTSKAGSLSAGGSSAVSASFISRDTQSSQLGPSMIWGQ